MNVLKFYTEDLKIAQSLLARDEKVTREYFYKRCYPLFKSIYDNYHTDCGSCLEFISEIYVLVLSPNDDTGKCQMENFRGESTLASWLKTACLFYCYNKYQRKQKMPIVAPLPDSDEKNQTTTDRLIDIVDSCNLDVTKINSDDVEAILDLMPNKRYETLIRLRYLDMKSNEEVAEIMGVDMYNYYNLHKRAKSQYEHICRKEEYYV